jgi:hypothetical protein
LRACRDYRIRQVSDMSFEQKTKYAHRQIRTSADRRTRPCTYTACGPPLTEAALRWLADATPAIAELLRLMDATPGPCGQSVITARRSA